MSFDKAEWHYGGDFPSELPAENGATHMGIFMAWVIEHGMEGAMAYDDELTLAALY